VDTTVLGGNVLHSLLGGKPETVCYVDRLTTQNTHTHTHTHIRLKGKPGGGKERDKEEVKENMHEKP